MFNFNYIVVLTVKVVTIVFGKKIWLHDKCLFNFFFFSSKFIFITDVLLINKRTACTNDMHFLFVQIERLFDLRYP